MNAAVIDLFCGVGGMAHGFVQEGARVVAGVDVDESCKYAFETNNAARFIARDVASLSGRDLASYFPSRGPRVLVGCAPCQPFSLYTKVTRPDTKWSLLMEFARLVEEIRPDVVSMENVPTVTCYDVFDQFVERLIGAGYAVTSSVVYGPDYGIPQARSRLVLLASRHGELKLIPPTHRRRHRTVRDAIGKLEPLRAGEVSQKDPLHRARGLTPINLERIRASVPGGTWRDWPRQLQLDCHKRETGRSFKAVYGRMSWDEPAPVMTTQFPGIGNGRFGHPEQDRAISLREAALLQTFPKGFRFLPPDEKHVSIQTIARQIGNAVPVRLGRIVARTVKRHLEELPQCPRLDSRSRST